MSDAALFLGCAPPEHGGEAQSLWLRRANRHGLIAGATGTGKTVSLQVLAEGFSRAGVPVFLADVKGDLAGISQSGGGNPKVAERAALLGIADPASDGCPTVPWDLFGEQGHPIRATVSEMGPLLLARLLELNDVQEGVLNLTFKVADDEGLLLLDLKDLRAMLAHVADNAATFAPRYGTVSKASVGAIQRQLLVLEQQGAEGFFGEPALTLKDFMRTDRDGRGMVNILVADKLMQSPRLYATFLLWMLSELFEELPEAGDLPKPKLVFFFDEAHLLFNDAPAALVAKIEQVARLIRSKGVSLWFITQNPADLPEGVLGQLGNRVQHGLRAFTAKDQKALRLAAQNYRANPAFDTAEAILSLGTGEAVTSLLEEKGVPGVAQRTLIRPPLSQLGPITDAERAAIVAASALGLKYGKALDRESAAELLARRTEQTAAPKPLDDDLWAMEKPRARRPDPSIQIREPRAPTRRSNADTIAEAFGKSLARQIGTKTGQAIVRGVLGSLFRTK